MNLFKKKKNLELPIILSLISQSLQFPILKKIIILIPLLNHDSIAANKHRLNSKKLDNHNFKDKMVIET